MPEAKLHIKQIVTAYKLEHPDEYEIVKEGVNLKRRLNKDDFASVEKGERYVTRALYEISETLMSMLVIGLSEDELLWLKMGGREGHEGGRWFARTFPEFALPDYKMI